MRKIFIYTLVLSITFAIACKNETMKSTDSKMPVAEKQPIKLEKHGDVRIDNYFWMRLSDEQKNAEIKDEQTQKVINYLYQRPIINAEKVKSITKLSMPSAYKLLELLETNLLIKEVTGGQRGRMYSFENYLKIFRD